MSWERRGNGRYYYRRRREGGRHVCDYIGAGDIAEAFAGLDAFERQERELARRRWRATVEQWRAAERALNDVENIVRVLTAAVLIGNGYHAHKRQWRKLRDE